MSKLDDEIAIELIPRIKRCKVCAWYEKQDPDIRESFDKFAASDLEMKKFFRACARLADPLDCEVTTFRNHLRTCLS